MKYILLLFLFLSQPSEECWVNEFNEYTTEVKYKRL